VPLQDRFEIHLVAAVRRLGRGPAAVGIAGGAETVVARRDADAGQLIAVERRDIIDVLRIVGRQPGVADLVDHAQPPERLQRLGRDMVAALARRIALGLLLQNDHVDTPLGEVERGRHADGPRADDHHGRVLFLCCHHHLPGQPLQRQRSVNAWPSPP